MLCSRALVRLESCFGAVRAALHVDVLFRLLIGRKGKLAQRCQVGRGSSDEPTRAPPPPAPARRGARVLSYVNTALRERPNDVDRTAQLSSTSDLEPPLSSRGPDSDLRVRENACPCTPVHAARARTTIPRSALNPCDAARPASKNLTMQHHPLTRCPTGAYTRRRACQAKLGEVFTSPDPLTALS